jgi:hypothetical protein
MLEKLTDGLTKIQAIVGAFTVIASSALSAWGALHFKDDSLEKRVEKLEAEARASGPPASFWEKNCAKLIDDMSKAPDVISEDRILRAMERAGCKTE